ncbi:MAG: hypothetical protein ABIR24_06955, partial [Verrucomicrobiota bacterium]
PTGGREVIMSELYLKLPLRPPHLYRPSYRPLSRLQKLSEHPLLVKATTKYVSAIALAILLGTLATWRLISSQGTFVSRAGLQINAIRATSSEGESVFTVTNPSDTEINYAAVAPQVRSNGYWNDLDMGDDGIIAVRLPAHKSADVRVTTPTNGESWRLAVVWGYATPRVEVMKVIVQKQLHLAHKSLTAECFTAYSPEVTRP